MARYKKLATVLKGVDYKKPYKPTTFQNMKHFINVLGHEMVHHYQYTIQGDTGNHNKKFYRWRNKFEKMGLELSRVA